VAFDTYVWGDYYVMNWPLSNVSLIVDKRAPLAHYGFVNTRFNAYSLEQGNSMRGPLISTYAPCGMFLSLDPINNVIYVELCGSPFSITETLVWNISGSPLADETSCHCINNDTNIPDYSEEVRASYMSFSSGDRIAFAVSDSLTSGPRHVYWAEVHHPNVSQTLALNQLPETESSWAPVISYECRANLAMTYYALSNNNVATKITYRSRSDPPGVMRDSNTFSLVPLQSMQPSFLQPFDQLAFLSIHPLSSQDLAVNYLRIANETLYYQWVATDQCGYVQRCPTTTITLGNVDGTCF
jgi:hypothetical protein